MGRTSPVVPAGSGERARRAGVVLTALTVTAAVLVAGCGTRAATMSARGGTTPAAAATAGSATARPATVRPGTGPGPAAGSRAGAQALADRLLSRLVLPPGARPVRLRVLPPLLRQPPSYGGIQTVRIHRLFLLRQPITAVQAFLDGHLPAGMRQVGSGQLAHVGDLSMESVDFEPRSLPAGIQGAELATLVVPAPGGGSLVRADAVATWYPARSAAEYIDPAGYRAAVVSITTFNPKRHAVTGTFTSSGVITRLARLVDGLHAAPDQPMSCPAVLASYRITFVPASRSAQRVAVVPSECLTVGVTVAGAAQPALWGDTGLIRAAQRLLHVRSVLQPVAPGGKVRGGGTGPVSGTGPA